MAARSLGTLTLDLVAKIGGFERGMDAAERKSKRTAQQMEKHAKKLGMAVGTMLAGGVTALAAFTVQTANSAREIQNLSKVANTNSQDFQKMTFAASRYGVEQEKVADVLKDVNDKVGDFLQTGGGPLKDFFENIAPLVGVTADQFKNLSGDQALQLYVDSLEAANLSQSDMTFYMEAIASDATKLLPLLSDNGKKLKELGDEAERTGNVFSDMDFEELAELDRTIIDFKSTLTGLKNEVVLAALPAINDMMDTLSDPAVIQGIKAIADALIDVTTLTIEMAAEFSTSIKSIAEDLASLAGGAALDDYERSIKELERLSNRRARWAVFGEALLSDEYIAETEARIKELQGVVSNFEKGLDALGNPLSRSDLEAEIQRITSHIKDLEEMNLLGVNTLNIERQKNVLESFNKALANTVELKKDNEDESKPNSSGPSNVIGTDLFGDGSNFVTGTSEAVKQYIKEQEAARKEAERLSAEIANQVAEWEKQAKTLGLSSDALAVYNLEQMGATDAQIESVKAAQEKIEAYNKLLKQEEDYKNLVSELRTEEEQLADQLHERLAILDAMGDLTDEQRNQTLGRIVDDAFSEAPEMGKSKDQEGIDEARSELEDWYSEQLDMLDQFRKDRADLNEEWNEKEAELKQEYEERQTEIERQNDELRRQQRQEGYMALLDIMGQYFDGMEGKEAAYARAAIQIGKTLLDEKKMDSIESIWTNTYDAAMGAYNALASIPYVGPFLGAAAFGAVMVTGAGAAASVMGMAHDGIDSVPETGTWLLEKGERVTTANTSAKLDSTLDRVINSMGNGRAGGGVNQTINVQGKPDRRTSKQIAQESAKQQRITAKRYGVSV